ncbi:hypothetical protein CSC41_5925 [Pseudomonas aeruginosa]|nr:hypothetical protein CSC41_5925 [Pseudomonas aeruginosa]
MSRLHKISDTLDCQQSHVNMYRCQPSQLFVEVEEMLAQDRNRID